MELKMYNIIKIVQYKYFSIKYLLLIINLIATFAILNCDMEQNRDANQDFDIKISRYVLGSHFIPADDLILTEFNKFPDITNGIINNYPMCIYPEINSEDPTQNGLSIDDPQGVLNHMEVIVNTWLPYLYNCWGFEVINVHFKLIATTQEGCPQYCIRCLK